MRSTTALRLPVSLATWLIGPPVAMRPTAAAVAFVPVAVQAPVGAVWASAPCVGDDRSCLSHTWLRPQGSQSCR